jgi:hypothetical protein
MVERNCFEFKYMESLAHHVGSKGALNRRRIFKLGTKIKY